MKLTTWLKTHFIAKVGSFNYAIDKMVFHDVFLPEKENAMKSVLDYDITISRLKPKDTYFTPSTLNMNYSVAGFELVLARKMTFYVITYYLPSGLFVVVSWISFLVNPECIPGRMSLLITIFLVLINIYNTIQTNSPQAEALTAMEAWLIACIVFVFACLIEYTAILMKMNLRKLRTGKRKKDDYSLIDITFLIIFPIVFLVFNIIYWCSIIKGRARDQGFTSSWQLFSDCTVPP